VTALRYQRDVLRAVRGILPDSATVAVESGTGKHRRLLITQGDRSVRLPIASTPTGSRTHLAVAAQAAKLFDPDGTLKPPPHGTPAT
jgi:hypothetical protein